MHARTIDFRDTILALHSQKRRESLQVKREEI